MRPEDSRIQYIKLLLDPDQELPPFVSRTELERQLKTHKKTAVNAAADFLTKVHETTVQELVKRFGQTFMDKATIDYVLTVPAVWSDAAKDATISAANMTGFASSLRMISEPEAAAVYALSTMKPSELKVGDTYIVVDAGGGTVDLVTYEIMKKQPLKFCEVVAGSGGLCGGGFLNIRFERFIRSRFGEATFKKMQKNKPKAWQVASEYFENYVKRNFAPSDDMERFDDTKFNVPFPGIPDDDSIGLECGFLVITSAEVAEIFRPLIDQVSALVENQRIDAARTGKNPKGVILVGGFGQSSHLYSCLKQRFADEKELPPLCSDPPPEGDRRQAAHATTLSNAKSLAVMSPMEILQPENAWTAVVRGAVLHGLDTRDLVASRKARRHYGTLVTHYWDPRIHDEEDKYWDECTEC